MDHVQGILDGLETERATAIADTYSQAVAILALNDRFFVPEEALKITMIRALLAHSTDCGFEQDQLLLAALAAFRSSPAHR